jgi:D-alanyl-D-alanine carboxypeptidase/D-alanyl-D-alanine-endopeptidase (penicillin-binding protein 4)
VPRVAAAVLAIVLLAPASASAARQTPLARKLSRALAVPHVAKSRSSALAVDLTSGKQLYARNLRLPLIPASNEKLAITYASLLALGPSYRFSTDVLGEGELDGTLWRGDIVLKGYGDPTLSTLDLLSLASQIRSQGIRRVTGHVVGDESFFDTRRMGPGWKPYFFLNESPALSALVVDRGRYQGYLTRQPALAAALSFRAALLRAGVTVAGRAMTATAVPDAVPLATIESVPLDLVLRFMDHESDNFTAEMLLKQLGAGLGLQGTTAAGAQVVHQLLAEQAIPTSGVRIVDGSGLSLDDRLTAHALSALLLSAWNDAGLHATLWSALPVAGATGTLEDRMQRRPARGAVHAKTGTTDRASALSGYVRDRYAFAVMQNGRPVATVAARKAQDRFATALASAP